MLPPFVARHNSVGEHRLSKRFIPAPRLPPSFHEQGVAKRSRISGELISGHDGVALALESSDTRKRAPFHPFEKCSAGRGNEAEILCHAGMVECCDRVPAAGDRYQ